MRTKQILLICLLFLWGVSMHAQEELQLSIQDAINIALENNRMIINADLAKQKSQLALKEAIRNGLPQIAGKIDYNNSLGAEINIKFSDLAPATVIPIKPTSNLNLTTSQMIFNGNYWVGLKTAELATEITDIQYAKTNLDVRSQVIQNYYLYQSTDRMLEILSSNVDNLDDLYKKTQSLHQAGMIEGTEVDQLKIQQTALGNVLQSTKRQKEMIGNMLRFQLGVDMTIEFNLTESLDSLIKQHLLSPDLANEMDITANVDYQMVKKQEEISREMIRMQQALYLPTITAFHQYTEKLLVSNFDMTAKNMLGLQMNIPIFSSGVRMSKVNQAKVDLASVQNSRQLMEDQLGLQDRQLKFNYQSAVESFKNQSENVEVAKRVYDKLQLKFKNGTISGLDLIQANNNYLKSESDYITALLEVLQSELQIKKLNGTL